MWLMVSACQPAPRGEQRLDTPVRRPVAPAPSAVVVAPSPAAPAPPPPPSAPACPEDMVYVDAVHCPDTARRKVGLSCTRPEKQRNANNLSICLEFAPGQRCDVAPRRQQFCIDRYEYPSKEGAHPPVMVSAYDAAGLCRAAGKRLCWESEWVAACEGPDKLPFPYGYRRSSEHCNIDNRWINPSLDKIHHARDDIRGPELMRLDQSVPSGGREKCKSGYGVYDLTGNFDEWVRTEWRRGKSKWAGLKGGGWGHVRNACRPITTSHVAHWSYYFISFRCCKEPDPEAVAVSDDGVALWRPPDDPPPPHPAGRPVDPGFSPPPGTRGPNQPPVDHPPRRR